MTKPYSLDLRERVAEGIAAGSSVRAVAATFTVSVASVVRLGAAVSADGQRRAWEDGWPSDVQSHWRTGLAHRADRDRARGDRAQAHDGTR
jgi:transposase